MGILCVCVCLCVGRAPPAVVRISPCHSRQPSVISDASAADGDRSSTPSDINSPRHRTHSLCNVRAAWPPRPSNHPLLLLLVSVPLSCPLAGCQPACFVVVLLFSIENPSKAIGGSCVFAFLPESLMKTFICLSSMFGKYEAKANSC